MLFCFPNDFGVTGFSCCFLNILVASLTSLISINKQQLTALSKKCCTRYVYLKCASDNSYILIEFKIIKIINSKVNGINFIVNVFR